LFGRWAAGQGAVIAKNWSLLGEETSANRETWKPSYGDQFFHGDEVIRALFAD